MLVMALYNGLVLYAKFGSHDLKPITDDKTKSHSFFCWKNLKQGFSKNV